MSIPSHRIPPFAKTTLVFLASAWGVLLIARAVTFCLTAVDLFNTVPVPQPADIGKALYIGAKFDIRLAVFMTIPLGLFLFIPWLENRLSRFRIPLCALYTCIFASVGLVYIIDYGYFFYLRQRVDSSFWDFLHDAGISLSMVLQTYPVFSISIALTALTALVLWLFNRLLRHHEKWLAEDRLSQENLWCLSPGANWKKRGIWGFALLLSLFVAAYGQISSNLFPLRWSNAYFSTNRDLVLLGLNPVQNLYDTGFNVKATRPDTNAVKAFYPQMSAWLRVDNPDQNKLDFWRYLKPAPNAEQRNVVIIIMESLSWPLTSFAPGDDDPTPNLRKIAAQGLLFTNYYASARPTARAVFSIMTNIPDANQDSGTTSSRNQSVVRQNLPMSEFHGYGKYYMIGGSASWANIRGILQHNVPDLNLLEESAWKSPNVDVWGISDLNLFREGTDVLTKSGRPFVAVIQTAGFHRPYTIPKDNAGFITSAPAEQTLRSYGFVSPEEYNSLRFSDHALGEFFRLAKKQPWFNNTVFAIVGDHGLYNPPQNMPGGYVATALQGYHVPCVLFAPGLLKPGRSDIACGHTDLFPTVAVLAGVPVHIHGMGRNLLDPETAKDARQYIADGDEHFRILVEGRYCYVRRNTEALYCLDDLEGRNQITTEVERAKRMRIFAEAYYQTTKYLLFNNKDRPENGAW